MVSLDEDFLNITMHLDLNISLINQARFAFDLDPSRSTINENDEIYSPFVLLTSEYRSFPVISIAKSRSSADGSAPGEMMINIGSVEIVSFE